jgi:hypothetical protein
VCTLRTISPDAPPTKPDTGWRSQAHAQAPAPAAIHTVKSYYVHTLLPPFTFPSPAFLLPLARPPSLPSGLG